MRDLCVVKEKENTCVRHMFIAHQLKLSALGIIYLLYDSTGVLGTDDKKIHTVK